MKTNHFKTSIILLVLLLAVGTVSARKPKKVEQTEREYWSSQAYRMAQPVLEKMAKGELQKTMQTEYSPSFDNRNRKVVFMETFGRLMAGIAPWIVLPDDGTPEGMQRKQLGIGQLPQCCGPQFTRLPAVEWCWAGTCRCCLYRGKFSPGL